MSTENLLQIAASPGGTATTVTPSDLLYTVQAGQDKAIRSPLLAGLNLPASLVNTGLFIPGNTYALGAYCVSPINGLGYECILAYTAVAIDPSIDGTHWLQVTGASEQELASTVEGEGADLIGNGVKTVSTTAALDLLTAATKATEYLVPGQPGGQFYVNPNDTTSSADNINLFVTVNGKRIYRSLQGDTNIEMAGAVGDWNPATATGTDNTNAINAVRALVPNVFVPNGNFNTTSLDSTLYGNGKMYVDGQRYVIPFERKREVPYVKMQSKLATVFAGLNAINLIGDSISEFYYETSVQFHWFNLLCYSISQSFTGAISEPRMTNWSSAANYDITLAGSYSIGNTGPVQRSLLATNSTTITFTGSYAYIRIWYNQPGSSVTATVYVNGVSVGTAALTSGASLDQVVEIATGLPNNGPTKTIEITFSGSVELTGLDRLSLNAGGEPNAYFNRFALTGQSTTLFKQQSVIASIAQQSYATNFHQDALTMVALGTNNCYNATNFTSSNQYFLDLITIFTKLLNAGQRVVAIGVYQASGAYSPQGGEPFQNYLAAQISACELMGVPLLVLNKRYWFYENLTADQLHPNNAGSDLFLNDVMDFLCGGEFDNQKSVKSRVYAPSINLPYSGTTFQPLVGRTSGGSGWVFSAANYRISHLNGSRVRYEFTITISTADNSGSGDFYVTLPYVAASAMNQCGTVRLFGTGGGSGYTYPILYTIGGGNHAYAVIQMQNVANGTTESLPSISNNTTISGEIEYVYQE